MGKILNYSFYIQKKSLGGDYMASILEIINNKTPNDLLREYGIDLKPPINVSLLLEKIGISVISKDFSDAEDSVGYDRGSILGAAISNGDDLAIFYRKQDTYNRKIFTVAHELGHCCKHAENLRISHIELRTTISTFDQHEVEANIFAGELLIPKDILLEKYKQFIIPSLKTLSTIFGVSTNVMAARLDYLHLDYYKDTLLSEE